MKIRKELVKTVAIIMLAIALVVSVITNCTSNNKVNQDLIEKAFTAGYGTALIDEAYLAGIISDETLDKSFELRYDFQEDPLGALDALYKFHDNIIMNSDQMDDLFL